MKHNIVYVMIFMLKVVIAWLLLLQDKNVRVFICVAGLHGYADVLHLRTQCYVTSRPILNAFVVVACRCNGLCLLLKVSRY